MTDLAYSGGGQMLKTGEDTDQGIESLCASLHMAGMNKVMPWVSPITERLPVLPARKLFRPIATRLFEQRMAKGREQQQIDVFTHLVRFAV